VRAAVTGARGRLGRRLVTLLAERGARVVALDRIGATDGRPEVESVVLDVQDGEALTSACHGCAVLFHLAAIASVADCAAAPERCRQVNVGASRIVADAAAAAGAGRVVLASTGIVYAPAGSGLVSEEHATAPASLYAETKLEAEEALASRSGAGSYTLEVARLSHVYGHDSAPETVVGAALEQALRSDRLELRDLRPVRDFIHADDVAEGLIRLAGAQPAAGVVTHLSTAVGTSIAELASTLARVVLSQDGRTLRIVEPEIEVASDRTDELVLDNARLRARTGWAPPATLERGLTQAYLERRRLR